MTLPKIEPFALSNILQEETPMHRTISQWAADAQDHVQFACNVSGLIFAFERCIEDITVEARRLDAGHDWIDHNPICVAWTDKLDDLSRSRSLTPIPTDEHLADLIPRFVEAMKGSCAEANRQQHGTDWRNQHPVAQEFVRRIVSITGSRNGLRVFDALADCEKLANQSAA